jgi:CO dehydrogenase maturation factor
MRIAFCGKGGSGKSTFASLTARYLAARDKPVLVVDGDINQHLGHALGFSDGETARQVKLGMQPETMLETVRGDNPRIASSRHITETTPAGNGSGFIVFDRPSPVFDRYELRKNGIRFISVGGHDESDTGATCFHKFTGAFGIFLNHLIDAPDEFLIGDMCAGADPFASSGLASRFDAVVVVVEPTLKSCGVLEQCRSYAAPYGIRLFAIGNKVENDADRKFIHDRAGDSLIGFFSHSQYVRNLEKGIFAGIEDLEPENAAVIEALLKSVGTMRRDWSRYQEIGLQFHRKAAECWGNKSYDTDLMLQHDPDFRYETIEAQRVAIKNAA